MKWPRKIPGGLLLSIAVLTACSGYTAENISSNQAQSLESEQPLRSPATTQDTATAPENTSAASSPTQSFPFEQNYGPNPVSERDYSDLEIITLLPQDAIPAIDNPEYYSAEEASQEYFPDELVLGIEFNGEARAYSVGLLSRHEIVNDTVGGIKLAVTW